MEYPFDMPDDEDYDGPGLRNLVFAMKARIAELEAENAALKAANEWHYLPETPTEFGVYLAVFEGAKRVKEAVFEPYYGKFRYEDSELPFDYRDALAWRKLPEMP